MAGGRTGAAQGALNAGRDVLRAISGQSPVPLLTYNPGPGIYSRLERAIEAMPEAVRTQELPGLLKRYKEGVPGWELKATDLDSVIAGRDVVPREELLARVKERSPVYTHKEQVRRDPPMASAWDDLDDPTGGFMQDAPLGRGEPSGPTRYPDYGQGGKDYTELLLAQPDAGARDFKSHWQNEHLDAVAHARYDTHGDALRINEIQSDLGIHNRRVQEALSKYDAPPQQAPGESSAAYLDRAQSQGYVLQADGSGGWTWVNDPKSQRIPFPLEDAWDDLLIKRLALEAAQKGHRAIEVAAPQAVFAKTGNQADPVASLARMEHYYGKVVPGALERLGRKMGGLTLEPPSPAATGSTGGNVWGESDELLKQYRRFHQGEPEKMDAFNDLLQAATPGTRKDAAERIFQLFNDGDPGYATAMTRDAIALADQTNAARAVRERLQRQGIGPPKAPSPPAGRRYIMSDEMRRRIIQQGIGASVLAPLLMQDEE